MISLLTLIKNVKIVLHGNEVVEASIVVEEGKIGAVVKNYGYLSKYDVVVDGSGLLAIPGGVDIHAHVHDPQYLSHEDFESGSIAALYGGITTFFDMPLRTYVEDRESLNVKVDAGLKMSYINFSIIAGMMNEKNVSKVQLLRGLGVKAFKTFTCKPFRPESDGGLALVLSEVSKYGGVNVVHAEDDSIPEYLVSKFKEEGREDPLAYHESRPDVVEEIAVSKVLRLASFLNVKDVHIAHLSSALGLKEIVKAKSEGINVTSEVTPHHLFFTKEDVKRFGNYLKLAPTLKTKEDVMALWKGLANGFIDVVASDHAPATKEEKEVSVWDAWGGIPNLETMLPLIFTLGFKKLGLLTLERFIKVTSENPAKIMGIYPTKGSLNVGSDADITLLDSSKCFKVKASELHHKVDWTPYEGVELCGWPRKVFVNGLLVLDEGNVIAENRKPKYLKIV